MKTRIRHVSYVVDFLDIGFNSSEISQALELKTDKDLKTMDTKSLTDWELQFRATYSNARQILISKNKFGSYRNDKIKEITIVIPIPLKQMVSWGVNKEQHIYPENHYDGLIKNFNPLIVNYSVYRNRSDYISNIISQAIVFCFDNKYSANGVTLKKLII